MRIRLITTVMAPFQSVHEGFNINLFKYLLPPLNLARIQRYEGQSPGDIIEIRFALPFITHWRVIIKESWQSHREYGFVDRGLRVPLGILYWKHTHRVVARDNKSSFIIDEIEYETSWLLQDYLLYLPLLATFYSRKFLYKRYYKQYTAKMKE